MTETTPDVGTFSVIDYAVKKAMPEDKITVYTNDAAAYRLQQLEIEDSFETDPEKSNERAEQIAALREQIKASGLTFHLRGLPTKVHQDITKEGLALFKIDKDTDPETVLQAQDWADRKTAAESIVRIEQANGAVDNTRQTPESIAQIKGEVLSGGEWERLWEKVQAVNFQALAFEQAVSADFS